MKNLTTITLLFCFLGITQAQEMYHTDISVVFDDVTFEEEVVLKTYPIVGYDTLYLINNELILEPIRLFVDSTFTFDGNTMEETLTTRKYYSVSDTVGIYPSTGKPQTLFKAPLNLSYPSGNPLQEEVGNLIPSESYKFNTIDAKVLLNTETMIEEMVESEIPCFQLHIGDEKYPMFQTDRYQSLITVEDANAMLKAKNISLVATCASQTGTIDFLQIKHRSEDYVAWVNDDKVDYSGSGDHIVFQVNMSVNQSLEWSTAVKVKVR